MKIGVVRIQFDDVAYLRTTICVSAFTATALRHKRAARSGWWGLAARNVATLMPAFVDKLRPLVLRRTPAQAKYNTGDTSALLEVLGGP